MRYVTALLVTGGATGHRFKDQLTARVAAELYDLTYVHTPFPKDLYDEHLWEEFLGFGDDHPKSYEIDYTQLKQVPIDRNAWLGSDLNYVGQVIKDHPEDNVIFIFTESARILVEQVEKSLRDKVINTLRKKYWDRRAKKPIASYFSKDTINVALHVRRGVDITPDKPTAWRYTKNNYYMNIINNLTRVIPHKINFHIYSEGKIEEFEEFIDIPGVYIHLCPWPPSDYNDLFKTFHHMITADILVTATSEFSYFLAHMNPGYILTLPVGDVVKLSTEERFAETNSNGSFNENNLINYLIKINPKDVKIELPHVYKAYIKTDLQENPEILENLSLRLKKEGIFPIHTERDWRDILSKDPFLYFRNPYIRFDGERSIAKFHAQNPEIPKLRTPDGEIISVNPTAMGKCDFTINKGTYLQRPTYEPLPILIGIHSRPLYSELTLNSLLYNLSGEQKVYIVASQPDPKCREIIEEALKKSPVETHAVITKNNLYYSFANFGSKFFNLEKFIHFEEDAIIPENIEYHIPFWTRQFNYRSTTTDLLSLRISGINYSSEFYKSTMYSNSEILHIPDSDLWHYTKPRTKIAPIGGMGMVIDSRKMYKNFNPPDFCTTDHILYHASSTICIANVSVYHLGANQEMDYHEYFKSKRTGHAPSVERFQVGKDMRTGEEKKIDLALDWENH